MAGKRGPGRPPGSKNKKYKGNNRETMALDGVVNGSEAGSTGSGSPVVKTAASPEEKEPAQKVQAKDPDRRARAQVQAIQPEALPPAGTQVMSESACRMRSHR